MIQGGYKQIAGGGVSRERGFTLLETMLAIGLSAMIMVGGYYVFSSTNSKLNMISEEVETGSDIETGQRVVLKDLKSIDPSYAALNLLDDKDRSFFEYYPDVSDQALEAKWQRPSSRTLTMKLADGGRREVVFLLQDTAAHNLPSMVYDPLLAHTIVKASSFYTSGSVVFQSLNFKNVLDDPTNGVRAKVTKIIAGKTVTLYPGYWNAGQLLMLDSPINFRSETNTDLAAEAPRPPTYVGRVVNGGTSPGGSESDFRPLSQDAARMQGQSEDPLLTGHPIRPTFKINSARDFFQTLPSAGGGQPLVRLRPVKLVKYYIEPMYPNISPSTSNAEERKKLNMVRLFRWVYTNGQWKENSNRFLVAEKLKSVQFHRKSVTDKTVMFTISRNELKKGE